LIGGQYDKSAATQSGKRQAKGPEGLHRDPPPICRQEDPLGIWRTADECRVNKGLPLLALFQRTTFQRTTFARTSAAPPHGVTPARDTATTLAATDAPQPGNDAPF
jgi:hypothetical protein